MQKDVVLAEVATLREWASRWAREPSARPSDHRAIARQLDDVAAAIAATVTGGARPDDAGDDLPQALAATEPRLDSPPASV